MRLSAFTVVDEFAEPGRSRLAEVLELAEACEEAGIDTLWVAEHHFHSAGVCPSPPVLLASVAARTRRLKVGSLVSVLPFHDPVLLAEEYAMVDQLSQGRLRLGVGSGYLPQELQAFGVDPSSKRERFDRALGTFLDALQGREVRVEGGATPPVRLNVRPRQSPHPPIVVAAQRREAVLHLGRQGRSVALIPYATVGSLAELAGEISEYRAQSPPGGACEVLAAVHLYAGRHPEEARSALARYLQSRLATQSVHYRERVRNDPTQSEEATIEANGFAVFGEPEAVASRLGSFAEAGVDELLGIFDFGGLALEEVRGSVAALARALRLGG